MIELAKNEESKTGIVTGKVFGGKFNPELRRTQCYVVMNK
jgi:hypothetical protein